MLDEKSKKNDGQHKLIEHLFCMHNNCILEFIILINPEWWVGVPIKSMIKMIQGIGKTLKIVNTEENPAAGTSRD